MLVILFISVFEYTYFCFKSVFEYLLHSLPWPYFHIYIHLLVSYKFLAPLPGIGAIQFLSLEVDILKNG